LLGKDFSLSVSFCTIATKTPYNAAEWAAKNIGMPMQTSDRESYTSTIGGGRDSVSTHNETNVDYLVTPNEIQNLKKLQGYFRYDEYVVPIQFQYPTLTGKDNSPIVSEQVMEEVEVIDPLLLPNAISLGRIDSNVRAPLRRVK
jgi:Type IV secretion-system coupling protein DNA-binding domain